MNLRWILLLSVTALAGAARASTIVVPGGALDTIQDGVDAAGPGDTVRVKSGVYFENVVIPAGKDGLRLLAKGHVTIDARPQGVVGTGPGIRVASAGVVIDGFTIRHAANGNANGVFSAASPGLRLRHLRVQSAAQRGIDVAGDGIVIDACVVEFCNGGIRVSGAETTVKGTAVRQDQSFGILLTGAAVTVRDCTLRDVNNGFGIRIAGDGVTVASCSLERIGDTAVVVLGDAPTIRDVRIRDLASVATGISVGSANSGTIRNNRISDVTRSGIAVSGDGLLVRDNLVRGCGTEDVAGIRVTGDGNTLVANVVRDGQSDGFLVSGDGNLLMKNTARGNGEDGFDVEGNDNVLTGNKARQNLAEGLENNGTGTEFSNNVAKGHRTDVANDGAFALFAGNSFASGGDTTPPEIDD